MKKDVNNTSVHFVLQGKGGVGKSLVAAFLAQYLAKSGDVVCIDTDPVNQTLLNYKALNAQHINLMDDSRINTREFDKLMVRLLSENGVFVVDNGAASFVPLSNYIIENNAIGMLNDAGRKVYIHCVITGGQALFDTLRGFTELAEQTESQRIIIWLNEYFGVIEHDDKTFLDMKAYVENKEKVHGIIRIAKRNPDTFGKDVEEMITNKLTFAEALDSPDFSIMVRQRLKIVQNEIFSQLEQVPF